MTTAKRYIEIVIIRRETRAYSGGDGIVDLLVGFPVPGQEFMEAWIGDVIDPCQDISEPCMGIDIVQARGDDQGIHGGGALSATIGPGEQPGFPAQGDAAQGAFCCIV